MAKNTKSVHLPAIFLLACLSVILIVLLLNNGFLIAKPKTEMSGARNQEVYVNKTYGFSIKKTASMVIEEPVNNGHVAASENAEVIDISDPNVNSISNFRINKENKRMYKDMEDFVLQIFDIKNGYIEPKMIPYDVLSQIRFKVLELTPFELSGRRAIRLRAEVADPSASEGLNLDFVYVEYSEGEVFRIYMELANYGIPQDMDNLLSRISFFGN